MVHLFEKLFDAELCSYVVDDLHSVARNDKDASWDDDKDAHEICLAWEGHK